ncbi:MAG: F0F1 ATP synthase subunit A [Rhodospirillales bacterium]|nr:F0F1 ATP synthase subunit A [Rhodospirillales bacterium]
MANPLHQFQVDTIVPIHIGSVDASFTNSSLYMAIAVTLITVFLVTSVKSRALVPGRLQSMAELAYEFVANMLRTNVGSEGRAYFPFIFSLFYFILIGNMLGMMPYSFTFTAQLVVTLGMALVVFIGTTIIGFVKHGIGFFGFFLPHGTPWYIAPLLVPIEILSYIFRPISLSLRLFANMTAGHTLLKVFAGFIGAFVINLGILGVFPGLVPMAAVVGLTGLEFLVAFLQAYVYSVLACIYLNDAIHMH